MIKVNITAKAFHAVDALTKDMDKSTCRLLPDGSYDIWLQPSTIEAVNALRFPSESFSDAILSLCTGYPRQ